jgi:hypothetical protein
MPATVYLHSGQSCPALEARGVWGLITDLQAWLGNRGRVTQGYNHGGTSWVIDFEAPRKAALDGYLPDLLEFLQRWGVPQDAYLRVFTGNNRDLVERRIEVWGGASSVVHHPRA